MGGIALVKELAVAAKKASQQEAQNAEAGRHAVGLVNNHMVALGLASRSASSPSLVLIGSTFLGIVTIAKPLRALVRPLEDIARGNFAVTVPDRPQGRDRANR